jgi:regulator of protease activity HflC (stomatin/prohibitin superfamily)
MMVLEFAMAHWYWVLTAAVAVILIVPSIRIIGPTEVGLVMKRFSLRKLPDDNPVAFRGEAGYQADLLMPGWRFKFWVVYAVEKHPWVQVRAGEIGVLVAQVGKPLPIGAKSAVSVGELNLISDLREWLKAGGQKGVQRPVLPPGSLMPVHPIGFLVITRERVHGVPVAKEFQQLQSAGKLTFQAFGLDADQLKVTVIVPRSASSGAPVDTCAIVTALEGQPLSAGSIASRLGEFEDVKKLEHEKATDQTLIEALIGLKSEQHNNYQDFDAFLRAGGRIGLQHDPLLYGAYLLNPFLVRVEEVPMLVVKQGEVAVIKAYVGLPTEDTSGAAFKFGSIVRPGHRGIWQEPLRTGKYAINPRCYEAERVPTAILSLNWAEVVSQAHKLDERLTSIVAKSREGFVFKIDLVVQIHVPDTKAPRVISSVGTISNLVNEVLQAAVGNHFRDKLQSMPAVHFIETRQEVQQAALDHIREQLSQYEVETRGVYIQDVILPNELVQVLTQREIANQEKATYQMQREAQELRIDMERAKGTADMQAQLAQAQVGVEIADQTAQARKKQADGEATFIAETGRAKAAEVEAVGLARAKGFEAQVRALGQGPTALINVTTALAERGVKIVPEILTVGGVGTLDGVGATLMKFLTDRSSRSTHENAGAIVDLGATAAPGPSGESSKS